MEVLEGRCAVAEAGCSCGRASAAVAMAKGSLCSRGSWLMPKLGGLISTGAVMKCLFSSARTWTNIVNSTSCCSHVCMSRVSPSIYAAYQRRNAQAFMSNVCS